MRSVTVNACLVLSAVAVFSLAALLPAKNVWAMLALALFLVLAVMARARAATHVALFALLVLLTAALMPPGRHWPWHLLTPLGVYHLILLPLPGLRNTDTWVKAGRLGKDVLILMLITMVGSALALIGWYLLLKPDVTVHLAQMPSMPRVLIPFAGLGFALLNAVMEEFAFRGILMHGLSRAVQREAVCNLVQALSFGLFHYMRGFPNGALGVGMTLVYGLLLGLLRNRSQGMLAPVITHFIADLAIFFILITIFA